MESSTRAPWWNKQIKSTALADAVWARVEALRKGRRYQSGTDLIYEAMFRGRPIGGSRGRPTASAQPPGPAPLDVNIIKSKVNAILSRMSKHRPFPVISCEDAQYTERQFATRVSAVLRSRLGQTALERDKLLIIRDALIRGTGVAKVVRSDGDVTIERTPRSELLVSGRDARYGSPRSLYQLKSLSPEALIARYADDDVRGHKQLAERIHRAATPASVDSDGYLIWGEEWADEAPQVEVAEAWHLPTCRDEDDGRHVVAIRGLVLVDEPWTRPRFPFALLHFDPPVTGQSMFGSGLVEALAGVQTNITDTVRDIREALYWGAALKVFMQAGTVKKSHLRARHPAVVEYEGSKPIYEAPNPVAAQQFSFLDWLINIADDISGLSRDFQSGKTQLGAGASGKAMDTLDDIQSDRFAFFQLMHSLFMVDLGTLMLDEARELAASEEKDELAGWIKAHDWKRIEVDSGRYSLKLEPINFLPGTRAGKLEAIGQAAQSGLITDPEEVLDLFDEPDLQRANRKALGPRRAIARLLQDLADPTVDLFELAPDAYFPLEAGMRTVLAEYQDVWAQRDSDGGESDEVLTRLDQWLQLAKTEQDRRAAEAAAANPPPPVPGNDPTMAPGAGVGGAAAPAPAMPPAVPPPAAPGM